MNDIIESKRPSAFKIIVVLILIGIITFASIKLVKTAPEAFSSLASIAESLTEYKNQLANKVGEDKEDNLIVTSNKTLAPIGETVELTWEKVDSNGSYTFSYTCTEGVALNILNVDGIKNIDCDKVYNVGNQSSLSINADSEKNRFSEVSYTIAFLGTNDTEPRAIGMASLTIVNEKISLVNASSEVEIKADTSTTSSTSTLAASEPKNTVETKPVVKAPTPKPAVVTKPVYKQEFIYTVPASDPNGKTDLGVKFLNSGIISRNTFTIDEIEQNENGAIQFEVKNFGTKTSSDWTFSVKLPSGETYTSSKQSPLKPNERAVLAIGFDATDLSKHNFVVTVTEKTDRNIDNNKFTKNLNFVK